MAILTWPSIFDPGFVNMNGHVARYRILIGGPMFHILLRLEILKGGSLGGQSMLFVEANLRNVVIY